MSKKFFFISFLLFCLTTPLQAEVLTISQEPAEFKALRAAYEKQLENASTPEKLQQLQQELEAAKEKSLQSPALTQKISSLESARDIEVKKIQTLYNDRIEALKKEAMDATERKYQVVFDNFKNNTAKNVKNQYIVDLKQLEDKLIRQNNLAGALVVQNERNKSMGLSTTAVTSPVAAAVAAAPVVAPSAPAKPAPVEKKATQTASASSSKLSSANPQSYISKTQGLAGSGSNVVNNIYAFDVQLFGNESWLSFNGYGRTTNSSFGEVYLITPAGQRHQVASWSPDQLKATNYFGVKSANDVQPIKADITQFVNATGTYKVEFIYRDGNEPLTIYQVEIKTW
ncbi:MAG: hypothetical protein KKD73_07170 [Proteobacteria bacterium]|nr:hypothetical protein [Pseudomonadota bacterium]MBU1640220.1 hypothetical protein [Pseudomonadota bacterium]